MAWRAAGLGAGGEHPRVLRTLSSRGEIFSLQTWHGPAPICPRHPSALGCIGWGFPRKCQNSPGLPGDSRDTQLAGGGGRAAGCCPQQRLLPWVLGASWGGLVLPCPPTHLSTMRCQDPHLPPPCPQGCQDRSGTKRRSHCLQPPQWCPHPQSPSHNQEDECHPLATTPSSAWAGGAGPALSIPCVPTSPLLPQAGDTPGAPQSFPTSTRAATHRHPRGPGHRRQGAAPAPLAPGAAIPTQGLPARLSPPAPCRAVPAAAPSRHKQPEGCGWSHAELLGAAPTAPRQGAGPPVPQATPPSSARNRSRERGGRAAHVGPLGSSSLSLHVAQDNGSL